MAEHSIFGSTVPSGTIAAYPNDAGQDDWTLHQFHNLTGDEVTITKLRFHMTGGAPFGLQTVRIGAMLRDVGGGPFVWGGNYPNSIPGSGLMTEKAHNFVAGWNEITLDVPITFPDGWWCLFGLDLNGSYVYSTDVDQGDIPAADGSGMVLVRASGVSDDPNRTWYGGSGFAPTASRWYGIDMVWEDGGTAPVVITGELVADLPTVTIGVPTLDWSGAASVPVFAGTLAADLPAVAVGVPSLDWSGVASPPAISGSLVASLPPVTIGVPTVAWAGVARAPGAVNPPVPTERTFVGGRKHTLTGGVVRTLTLRKDNR